jgi:hypothetical protein
MAQHNRNIMPTSRHANTSVFLPFVFPFFLHPYGIF